MSYLEILIAPSVWVDVALLFQWLGKVSSLASLGRNYLCDVQVNSAWKSVLWQRAWGTAQSALPMYFFSCVTHLCGSLCDCHLGQGQALTGVCLSVTGAPGCLFRPKELIAVLAWYVKTFIQSIFMDSLI